MSLKRVGYIRVSTGSDEQLGSLENQRATMQKLGVDEIVEDVQSGRDADRPGYQHLIELIIDRKVSEVWISSLDRLGRNAQESDLFIYLCAKYNVKLCDTHGGEIESKTPTGFLLTRVSTTIAELESRILSLRIRRGLEAGRKRGRPLRGSVAWGYRNNVDHSALEPDPIEFPRAKRFLHILRSCNWQLNTALTQWHQSDEGDMPLHTDRSVRVWLMNPVLRGGIGYGLIKTNTYKEVVWNTHEALLSHEEFAEVQKLFERNKVMWGYNNTRKPRLLTSLCFCGFCHKRMSYAGSRKIPALICKTRYCPQQYKSTREETIKAAVLAALSKRAETLAHIVEDDSDEIERLQREIDHLVALNDPDVEVSIAIKRQKMHDIHKGLSPDPKLVEVLSRATTYSHLSDDELRELFQQLVQSVTVKDQSVSAVQLRL